MAVNKTRNSIEILFLFKNFIKIPILPLESSLDLLNTYTCPLNLILYQLILGFFINKSLLKCG
jgi:hypothetical protein